MKAAFLILNSNLNTHKVDRYLFCKVELFFKQKECLKYSELRHEKRIAGFRSRRVWLLVMESEYEFCKSGRRFSNTIIVITI